MFGLFKRSDVPTFCNSVYAKEADPAGLGINGGVRKLAGSLHYPDSSMLRYLALAAFRAPTKSKEARHDGARAVGGRQRRYAYRCS